MNDLLTRSQMEKLDRAEDKEKLIYEWVRTGHIDLGQFKNALSYVDRTKGENDEE